MTAVGLVAGIILTGISACAGKGGLIEIVNNAVTFTNGFNFRGSITLGNTIIHAGGSVKRWNKNTFVLRYDNNPPQVNIGRHEEAHTYQYQKFGIFTIPLLLGSAIKNGGLGKSTFRDFLGRSKMENKADDYAQNAALDNIPTRKADNT